MHTLDTYYPNHEIVFYDLGLESEQETLVKEDLFGCLYHLFLFS